MSLYAQSKAWIGVLAALGVTSSQVSAQTRPLEDVLGIRGKAVIQVAGVEPGQPAAAVGVRPGDLIWSVNGHTLREFNHFTAFLDSMRAAVFETGARLEVMGYDEDSDSYVPRSVSLNLDTPPADASKVYLGMRCGFAYLVTEVLPGSPAQRLGLSAGDFLEWVNGQRSFYGPVELDRAVSASASSPDREITLWVTRWRPVANGTMQGSFSRTLTGHL